MEQRAERVADNQGRMATGMQAGMLAGIGLKLAVGTLGRFVVSRKVIGLFQELQQVVKQFMVSKLAQVVQVDMIVELL